MENESVNFSLDVQNVNHLPFQRYEKNFTFIVNGKVYETTRIIADLLSPFIRNLHFIDETINEFSFNTKIETNPNDNTDYFSDFLALSKFEIVYIDAKHRQYYSEYFNHLGNYNEYFRLHPIITDEITTKDAIDQLISITEYTNINPETKEFFDKKIRSLVKSVAVNFECIDKRKLRSLSYDIIEEIISSESLKLHEEDTLLQFVIELYENNHNNASLFEYIIFQNVSDDTFKNFITKFEINDVNEGIWKSVCHRLLSPKTKKTESSFIQNRYLENIREFEYIKGYEFQGIMRYLTQKTGGNIHDNGTIEITTNSFSKANYQPKNLVDYDKDNYYHSNDDIMANIYFDFKEKSVQLVNYTIKSYSQESYTGHLRSWTIEVSDNGKDWLEIDRHEDDDSLNGPNRIVTFNVKNTNNAFHRFVRLHQTGNNWNGNGRNFIYFYNIEFYGKLKQPSF
ncbi:hypothetical protein M9Y10_025575 [Tritrichomonas musculus]|uniref:F5/8 type C domain-containing protein n=1 Tax=Tritrichomonas musculus TaxID=1915356 RepID=A0ABR2H936_9EUKA